MVIIGWLLLCGTQLQADWPQFLGPNRDGIARDVRLEQPPSLTQVWAQNVGLGYSGISIAEGRAFTVGHDAQGHETLFAFDADTGKALWSFRYEAARMKKYHPGGPNATPTLVGDALYSVSKDGQCFRMNAADGKVTWRVNLEKDLGIPLPKWGFASSALVRDGLIYMNAGHPFVLDAETGDKMWSTETSFVPGYASATLMPLPDRTAMLSLFGNQVGVFDAADGALLVSQGIRASWSVVCSTPVVLDASKGIFFVSTTKVGRALRTDGQALMTLWETRDMKNEMNTCVLMGGHLYGVNGKEGSKRSMLTCLDARDGVVKWSEALCAYGSVIATQDHLLVLKETGELIMAEINAEAYVEVLRKQVLEETCWTPMSLANGKLYVRNDKGRLLCLSLDAGP